MNVYVTGITGKSGRYLFEEIKKSDRTDISYTFLVRDEKKAEQMMREYPVGCVHLTSLSNAAGIAAEFKEGRYDTLLHVSGIFDSEMLVRGAVDAGVTWLILVHTTGVYSKYKAAGEEYRQIEARIKSMIEGKGIALTILRPTMIYGDLKDKNVSVFMKMVYKMRLCPVVAGARFDLQPVWCGDLGKAYYQVLTAGEITKDKDYILSGGRPIQLREMLEVMAKKLGVKNTFVSVPFWMAYSGAWVIYCCTFGKIDLREKVQRLVEPRAYSHELASADFGYAPLNFEDGIDGEIEEFKKEKDAICCGVKH